MNKRVGLFIGALLVIVFTSGGCINFYGQYPYDYGTATWISDDPHAEFFVHPDTGAFSEGNFYVDDTEIPFIISFEYSEHITFSDDAGNPLLTGVCTFSPNKLIVKVTSDSVYNNQYEEIIFNRNVK